MNLKHNIFEKFLTNFKMFLGKKKRGGSKIMAETENGRFEGD